MELLVHKGNHEIGGTCIQVTSGTTTILLDVGLPLSAASPHVDVSQLKLAPSWSVTPTETTSA